MWSLVDVIFAGSGVYMLYSWFLMKTTGEIKTTFLMSKDVELRKCKDLDGYKAFIMPKLLIFGLVTLIYGASGLINTYVMPLPMAVYVICMIVFMAVLVWFAVQSKKGVKRFW